MDSSDQSNGVSAVALTHATIQRLARQSAVCKVVSALWAGVVLMFASSPTAGDRMLWAALPLALVAVVDGCYGAKARRLAGQFNAGRAPQWDAFFENDLAEGGPRALAGVASLAVWPYYLALGLVLAGVSHFAPPTRIVTSGPAQPLAGMPQGTPLGYNSTGGMPARPGFPPTTQGPLMPGGQTTAPGAVQQQPLPNRNTRFQGNAPAVPGTGTVMPRPPGVTGPNGSGGPTLQGNPMPRPPTSVTPPPSSQVISPVPPANALGTPPAPSSPTAPK